MLEYSERYITCCIERGFLTYEVIRKYPLRPANLAAVLKAYAIDENLPYQLDSSACNELEYYSVYLTDAGLLWLFGVFQAHTLPYLRSMFQFVFTKATEKDLQSIENFEGMRNFKGENGVRPKAGTKQAAILVRRFSKHGKQTFHFSTIREARDELFVLLRFYPLEQFTLYRVRAQQRGGRIDRFKEEIPLLINTGTKGAML